MATVVEFTKNFSTDTATGLFEGTGGQALTGTTITGGAIYKNSAGSKNVLGYRTQAITTYTATYTLVNIQVNAGIFLGGAAAQSSHTMVYKGGGRFAILMNDVGYYSAYEIKTNVSDGQTVTFGVTSLGLSTGEIIVTINSQYSYLCRLGGAFIANASLGYVGVIVTDVTGCSAMTATSHYTSSENRFSLLDQFTFGTAGQPTFSTAPGSIFTTASAAVNNGGSSHTASGGQLVITTPWTGGDGSGTSNFVQSEGFMNMTALATLVGSSWAIGEYLEWSFDWVSGRGFSWGGAPYGLNCVAVLAGTNYWTHAYYDGSENFTAGNVGSNGNTRTAATIFTPTVGTRIGIRRVRQASGSGSAYVEGVTNLVITQNGVASDPIVSLSQMNGTGLGAVGYGYGKWGYAVPARTPWTGNPGTSETLVIDNLKVEYVKPGSLTQLTPPMPSERYGFSIYGDGGTV